MCVGTLSCSVLFQNIGAVSCSTFGVGSSEEPWSSFQAQININTVNRMEISRTQLHPICSLSEPQGWLFSGSFVRACYWKGLHWVGLNLGALSGELFYCILFYINVCICLYSF